MKCFFEFLRLLGNFAFDMRITDIDFYVQWDKKKKKQRMSLSEWNGFEVTINIFSETVCTF